MSLLKFNIFFQYVCAFSKKYSDNVPKYFLINQTIFSLFSKLAMSYNKGEVVLRCKPFSYIVKNHVLSSVCDFCLSSEQIKNSLKKCSNCKIVYYCNVSCQKNAWYSHHKEECTYLKNMYPLVPPDIVRMTVRTILKYKRSKESFVDLPSGKRRYFHDLMSHRENIIKGRFFEVC